MDQKVSTTETHFSAADSIPKDTSGWMGKESNHIWNCRQDADEKWS